MRIKEIIKRFVLEETNNTKIQFIRYFFVGGIVAVVNIGSLYVLSEYLNIYYIFSNIIGFLFGLIVNYVLSKKLVFCKNNINKGIEFIIYTIIGILGLLLDTILVFLISEKIGLYYMMSKIISTLIVFIWNFFARKIIYIITSKKEK